MTISNEIINKKWVLKERPIGMAKKSDFELQEEQMDDISENEIILKNKFISFDPTQRGWLNDAPGYLPPVQIDEVVRAMGVGEVVESKNDQYQVGDLVIGFTGWQTYNKTVPSDTGRFRKLSDKFPIPTTLNVLGATGITAYYGMVELGQVKEGMNVLVSGAAGATGSVAAQIAKLNGCNVIGIAGGESKCSWLKNDCGLDEVIDYKNSNVADELKTKAKNGIDLFFDNVGGEILESALNHINLNAKVLLCGGISGYNSTEPLPGPRNLMNLVIRRATIEGFLVMDYLPNSKKALKQLEEYLENNQLEHQEDILTGIENCPDALNRLFTGQNIGKQLVEV